MRAHLVAVQARLEVRHVATAPAFRAWVVGLADRAMEAVPADGGPVLLAYPEAIALPLALALDAPGEVLGATDLARAAWQLMRREWPLVLREALRHRRPPAAALWLARAVPAYRAYAEAFAEVARRSGATVVAGSGFFPAVAYEAARGWHVADGRVFNRSTVFSPAGRILGGSAKVYLAAGAESRAGLTCGRLEDLRPVHTALGPVGVAICLDGWFDDVVAALDGQGARVLVQPSANDADWGRPWPPDPRLSEGEAWLARGLRSVLQRRSHLLYAVNPMLVGEAMGFRPRGRSSVLANAALVRHAWVEDREGVVALAPDSKTESVVVASVDLPDPGVAVGPPAGGVQGGHAGRGPDGRMRP